MKKSMKRIIAVLLAVVMVLPIASFNGIDKLFAPKAEAASYPSITALKIPRIKQISGDSACYLCSFTSVEAYHRGSYSGTTFSYGTDYSQTTQLYKDIKSANGGKVGWSSTIHNKYGYTKDDSPTLAEIYYQLSLGKPVIVYGTSSTYGTHASVIIAYNGSSSTLEQSGFTVMEINASYWNNSQSIFNSYANNPQTYSTSGGNCYVTLSSWLSKASRSMNFISYRTNTPTPTTYTLTYNANGGSGAPSAQTGSTSYTISSTVPTRFGYTFKGWTIGPDGGLYHWPGETLSLSSNTTLYAVWWDYELSDPGAGETAVQIIRVSFPNQEYYVKFIPSSSGYYIFDTSGYGLDTVGYLYNASGAQLAYNDDGGVNIDSGTTTRDFRISYNVTAGTVYYIKVRLYNNATGDFNLYAYPDRELYYNANGGTGAPSTQTGDIVYTISSTIPTRTNYIFLGWSTNSNATSAEYQPGSTITLLNPTTLYAVWKYNPPTTYTLTYNANGGSGAPSSQTGSTSYAISSTVPQRVGYTFLGWATTSSGSSSTYIPGNTITLSSNTTLYASWQEARTANTSTSNLANINFANQVRAYKFVPSTSGTYIFESNGSTDSKIYLYNSSGTELANNDDGGNNRNFRLTYNLTSGSTYYLGVRIYSEGTGSVPFTVTKESSTPSTPTTYTLTYNANGGSGAPSAQTGSTRYTISSTSPTRNGYSFLGWSTNSSATSASYVAGNTITLSANTTLYAVWSRNPSSNNDNIKVTIRNNPGTRTLNYGDTVRLYADTENLPAGARIGWFTDNQDTVSIKVSEDKTYCDITAIGTGSIIIAVKAIDANGNVMTDSQGNQILDAQQINAKSSIWLMIVSFFKNLFGANRTTIQYINGIF